MKALAALSILFITSFANADTITSFNYDPYFDIGYGYLDSKFSPMLCFEGSISESVEEVQTVPFSNPFVSVDRERLEVNISFGAFSKFRKVFSLNTPVSFVYQNYHQHMEFCGEKYVNNLSIAGRITYTNTLFVADEASLIKLEKQFREIKSLVDLRTLQLDPSIHITGFGGGIGSTHDHTGLWNFINTCESLGTCQDLIDALYIKAKELDQAYPLERVKKLTYSGHVDVGLPASFTTTQMPEWPSP